MNSVPFEQQQHGGGGTRRRTHSDSVIREDSVISSFHEDDNLFESPREKLPLLPRPAPGVVLEVEVILIWLEDREGG